MKFVSTMALGVALALGASAAVNVSPALAADKAAAAQGAPLKLSKEVREPVAAAQTAFQAGDFATARAKLDQARPLAKTPDEQFAVASTLLGVAQKTSDNALLADSIDMMLASGKTPAANASSLYMVGGQLAFNAKNYPKADQLLSQAIQQPTVEPDAYALLAQTKVEEKQPQEALKALQGGIDKMKAANQPVPSAWLGRGVAIAYTNKLAPQAEQLSYDWVSAYPTRDNWRDSLTIYRELNKPDPDTNIDFMRLMRAAGAMKGLGDYIDYAEAVRLKYPGEAKAVLDEGSAAGFVKLDQVGPAKDILTSVQPKLAGDKALLDKGAAAAKGASGTGKQALTTADGYLGYGMWDKAIDLYNVALQKGGVDANVVNTRLGIAQARAGQKDAAKATFAKVTGNRAALAKYWTIWLDKGSQAA